MKYISLGSTCCVAYQMRMLNKRYEALPFDWIRINNLAKINFLLKNKFKGFLDENKFQFIEISNKFEVNGKNLSYVYDNGYCRFYHEFDNYFNTKTFSFFKEKFKKRIERLYSIIIKEKNITFIREEIGNLSLKKINDFSNIINILNPNLNWKLIIITRNSKFLNYKIKDVEFIIQKEKVINWRRPEINWKNIFRN